MKHLGSDSGYPIPLLNPIQGGSREGLARSDTGGEDHPIIKRFWSCVNKTTPEACWLWTASVTGGNKNVQHGQFRVETIDGKQINIYAHRFSWVLAYGSIPDGLKVCHRCDVPRCVRPEHLFLGTQGDNLLDAIQKGRLDHTTSRTTSVFALADRLAIFHMPDRRGIVMELALRYGVSKACISLIRRGRFVGSPTVEGQQRPSQARGSGQHQIPGPLHATGFALDPVPYRQLRIVGEAR